MGHQERLTATGLVPMAVHLRANAASASATGNTRTLGSPAVLVMTLPPNFCGGAVKMSVTLTTPVGELPGTMTVICIIGPNPPNSVDAKAGEGVMLVVPGIVNCNHTDGGDNVIIQTS